MKTRTAAFFFAALAAAPAAQADNVTYFDPAGETNATCETCTAYTGQTTLSDGWYVVEGAVASGGRITVGGDVNLILADGAELTAEGGIRLAQGNSLTVWAQRAGTGKLTANATSEFYAGIGGNGNGNGGDTAGTLTVNGGAVSARGSGHGAGVGGGNKSAGGTVVVNGGSLTASGRDGAAGIGGGDLGHGGTVVVNGGTVTATGSTRSSSGQAAPGIGAGRPSATINKLEDHRTTGPVTINGGTVEATAGTPSGSGAGAQAIGLNLGDAGPDYAVTVYAGAKVTAGGDKAGAAPVPYTGPESLTNACANAYAKVEPCTAHEDDNGLCHWCGATYMDPVSYVDRAWNGNAVAECNATCATYTSVTSGMSTTWSAGWYVVNTNVEIGSRIEISGTVRLILCDGFTLTAKKGIHLVGNGKSLTIYGQVNDSGALTISGVERDHAGIGGNGNDHSSGEDGGALTINGGTVKVNGGELGAGIGGGASLDVGGGGGGNVTVNGGNVTANGGERGAGIGGGSGNDVVGGGGTVTVNGGNVTANGGQNAAGIGGGVGNAVGGAGGNVTVKGGTVIAKAGSSYAQAIGGGQGNGGSTGAPGTLTIDGMKAGYADGNGNVASWVASGERDGCCRNKEGKRVRIEVCDPHEYGKNGVCAHCGASGGPVDYFDPMGGTNATCAAYTPYVGQAELTNGWYVVTGTVLSINRVTVSDDVNLILVDDTTLTAALGITVANANSLTIWAQGAGGNEGTLFAGTTNGVNCLCGPNQAGVGGAGQGAAGRVAVNGGKVVANGGLGASGVGGTDGTVAIGQGRMILTPQGGRVSDDGSVVVDADGVAARKVVIGTPVPVLLLDEIPSQVYTGSALSPSLTVTCLGASLEEGTDYTVAYSANGVAAAEIRNAGEYTVTVTGAGDYAGAQEASGVFAVTKASLTITAKDQTYRYNGMQQGESDPLYATPEEIAEKVIVNGLKGGDTIDHVELGGEATDAGCYPIEPRGAAVVNPNNVFVTENYDITYVNGTLTILGPAEVSGVQAAAQEPWNGKISLSFTVTNSPAACLPDWNAPFLSTTCRWRRRSPTTPMRRTAPTR